MATAGGTAVVGETDVPQKCNNCATERKTGETLRCSQCDSVAYCSRKCQKERWTYHKPLCEAISFVKKQELEQGLEPLSAISILSNTISLSNLLGIVTYCNV